MCDPPHQPNLPPTKKLQESILSFCAGVKALYALIAANLTRPRLPDLGARATDRDFTNVPCRQPFTVTMGTILEDSHIELHKWLLAFHLMAASKKGISSHQLHRMLGITYKSAWFMTHRIREAMKADWTKTVLGGSGPVEADETFIGTKPGTQKRRDTPTKTLSCRLSRETAKSVPSMFLE